MEDNLIVDVAPPRVETLPETCNAGLAERFSFDNATGVPSLWRRFSDHLTETSHGSADVRYGVCYDVNGAEDFRYMAGVEVASSAASPSDFSAVTLPKGRYAVYEHRGHIADLRKTIFTIWHKALPDSSLAYRHAPDFERYDRRFDPDTGEGLVEIWMPID